MQNTSKTAEDYASYRSCNLYQMYVWLTKTRCKKPRIGVPKVPATGFEVFMCAHWRGFWTVVIFNGASWAWGHSGYSPFQLFKDQGCPFRNTSVLTTAPNSLSTELMANMSLETSQPHSYAKNAMHPHLPTDQTCLNHRKHLLPPPRNWADQGKQLQCSLHRLQIMLQS